MKLRVLGMALGIGIIVCGALYLSLTSDNLKTGNSDDISSIYSSDDYTETRYSGNTEGTAQHLIEIANNSWQQGCEVEKKCFLPHMKTIMVNDVIMFANQDDFEHNILVRGDSQYLHFPADVIRADEYFVYKFSVPGKYDYFCTLHPWMEGKITVER